MRASKLWQNVYLLGKLLLYNWSRFVNTESILCAFFMFLAHKCWGSQSSLTIRLYTAGEEIEAVDQTKDPQWRTCIIIWQSCSTSDSTYSEVLKLCYHDVEQWTVNSETCYQRGAYKCYSAVYFLQNIRTKTCQNCYKWWNCILFFLSCPSAQMCIVFSEDQFSVITSLVATNSIPSPIRAGHWKMLFQRVWNSFNWTKFVDFNIQIWKRSNIKSLQKSVIAEKHLKTAVSCL